MFEACFGDVIDCLFDEYLPKENAKHVLGSLKENVPGLRALAQRVVVDREEVRARRSTCCACSPRTA
jgi:hypothetical protein